MRCSAVRRRRIVRQWLPMRYLPQLPLGFLPLLSFLSVERFLSVVSVRILPFLSVRRFGFRVRLQERVGKLRRQRLWLPAAMPRHGQLCALLHKRRLVLVQ